MTGSMRTNRRTRGKFRVGGGKFRLRQDAEVAAIRRAKNLLSRSGLKWIDLEDHEAYESRLDDNYLMRMDRYPEGDNNYTVYVDLYDFKRLPFNEPPETIAEYSKADVERIRRER